MPSGVIDAALAVKRVHENKYTTNVGSDFRMGEFLYGGFAAALVVNTALEHAYTAPIQPKGRAVTAVHVQILAPITREDMTLEVHHAHLSKTTANLRVLLSQKDTVKLSADITIIDTASPRGLSIDKVFRLSPPPAPVDLVKLEQNIDRNWIRYHIPYNKNSGAIPETHWYRHFDRNGPSDPRVHDCWWCFADPDSRICNSIIPYLADIHLRMVYNFEETSDFSYAAMVRRAERSVNGSVRQEDLEEVVMTLWPATQSIHLEIVRQLPPAGIKWVFQRAEAKAMNEGKLVVEVTILDEKMELIAIGQTVDLIIPARSRVKDGTSSGKGAKIWKI